jgi:hypothetical protein
MAARAEQRKVAHLLVAGKQREEQTRKGQGKIPFKDMLPSDLFPPTRPHLPEFHYLPVAYVNFESISGSIY